MNLIGEHIDYNGGLVLPFAIGQSAHVTVHSASSRRIAIRSLEFGETVEWPIPIRAAEARGDWSDIALGVLTTFETADMPNGGLDIKIASSIPIGCGLGSSAAVSVALHLAFSDYLQLDVSDEDVIQRCQAAESNSAGKNCGVMDQTASLLSQEGHAMLFKRDSTSRNLVPLDGLDAAFVLIQASERPSNSTALYNQRRQECMKALRLIRARYPADNFRALCDIPLLKLQRLHGTMPGCLYARALHAIEEHGRVRAAVQAIERGCVGELGQLMVQSHKSLRDNFAVSSTELDFLVDIATANGAYGARLLGGGFGGASLHLVPSSHAGKYLDQVRNEFRSEFGRFPKAWRVEPSSGAGIVGG